MTRHPAVRRQRPALPVRLLGRARRSLPVRLLSVLRRLPARWALALLLAAVALLPPATATLGKGARGPVGSGGGVNLAPTPSGAERAYPANHSLDATGGAVATIANTGFESAPLPVGTPPANHDFAAASFTGWTVTGSPTIQSDPVQGSYARTTGTLTSAAFSVDATAQSLTVALKGLTSFNDQYRIVVLSGATFATVTQVAAGTVADTAWERVRADAVPWRGQSIKLKIEFTVVFGAIGVDDAGVQGIDLPGWTATGAVTRVTGGPTGAYVRLAPSATLTSAAFTVSPELQQVTLRATGEGSASAFVELLRGPDFATVVDLTGVVSTTAGTWKTVTVGMSLYAGETVKLRVRQFLSSGWYDDVGVGAQPLPGWRLAGHEGVTTGTDAFGSYAAPTGASVTLRSSLMQTGILDRTGFAERRYLAVSASFGTVTGSLLRVTWTNMAGASWVVLVRASDSPTGYRTYYLWLADFMGQTGDLSVQVSDPGGRLYSVADNLARQALVEPFSSKVGLRIDTSTGAFGFAATDVTDRSGGGALGLSLARHYHGHSDQFGALGWRWRHSFDTRLALTGLEDDAGVEFGDGRQVYFDWVPEQLFKPAHYEPVDPRIKDTLAKQANGTYLFTTVARLAYRFGADGRLLSITDPNGNTLTPAYDAVGRVTSVTGAGGAALTFAYNAQGQLISVTDPAGGVTQYTYDTAGDLASARNPVGGIVRYTYDQHRLIRVVDESGATLFTNTLDVSGRVVTQSDVEGKTITLAYDLPAVGVTRVTDPNGAVALYYHDAWHRTTDKQDPLGRVVTHHYDTSGNLVRIVDPALNQWQFAYDGTGMPATVSDPLGHAMQINWDAVKHLPTSVRDGRGNLTTLEYDAAGNTIRRTDPLGGVWQQTYDARGNVLTETNPLGQTTTSTYNARNQRTSRRDALGNTWTTSIDILGRVEAETDPLGNTTSFTYDLFGRELTRTDPTGGISRKSYTPRGLLDWEENPLGERTTYGYNARHLLAARTDPAGKVWSYGYDDNRRRISETDPLGNITRYTYDAAGRVTAVTDPLGNVSTTTYDTAGNVTAETDPLGRTTSTTYDTAGKALTETAANGGTTTYTYDADGNTLSERNALMQTVSYLYDAAGRQTRVTDPLGRISTSLYDLAGRLTESRDPLNLAMTYTYDAAGRTTAVTNPLGQSSTTLYDAAGRVTETRDPLGRRTTHTYDAAGRRLASTDPAGVVRSQSYNAAGRLVSQTTPAGTSTHAYDSRGLLLSRTNPLGQAWSFGYDAAGRKVTDTDPRGAVTIYGYDAAGQQTSLTDALGGVVRWTFDAAGQETSLTNARGKTGTTTYDSLGNVLTERDPLGRTTAYLYDVLGRPTRQSDPRGTVIDSVYDAGGQLTAVTYPGGGISYTYDLGGRQTAMTDATGTTSWSYDAAGRTSAVASPQGTVTHGYNAAGQRTSLAMGGGRTVSYNYDTTTGRLVSLVDWGGRSTSFGYDAEGRRSTVTRPNGVVSATTHDAAGRKTAMTHTKGAATLQSWTAAYDAAGNRTSVTGTGGAGGAGTESYVHDALGRLTSVSYPVAGGGSQTVSYGYDAHGNRLARTPSGGAAVTTSHDDADQILSDGGVTSTYDAAGNLLGRGTETYTWDWRNRMAGATVGGTLTTYGYDADDVRVSKTTAGSTTTYLWDRESGLPLLLDDGGHGSVWAGESLMAQVAPDGTVSYPLTDPLGSVRGVSDSVGALVGSRDYDVYGGVRATSGAFTTRHGYTGEYTDAETSLVHLRARQYDPTTGRFLSRDTVSPNAPGTQGYHAYAYAANNPTTWTDPSGHSVQTPIPTGTGTGMTPVLCFGVGSCLMTAIMTAIVAMMAATEWAQVGVHWITGDLAICSADDICGGRLTSLWHSLDAVLWNPNPLIAGLVSALFTVIPIAFFAFMFAVAFEVNDAVRECFASGRCDKKSCPIETAGDNLVYVGLEPQKQKNPRTVTYVGITGNLRQRQGSHNAKDKGIDIEAVGRGYARKLAEAIETYLVHHLQAHRQQPEHFGNGLAKNDWKPLQAARRDRCCEPRMVAAEASIVSGNVLENIQSKTDEPVPGLVPGFGITLCFKPLPRV